MGHRTLPHSTVPSSGLTRPTKITETPKCCIGELPQEAGKVVKAPEGEEEGAGLRRVGGSTHPGRLCWTNHKWWAGPPGS